MIFTIEQAFNFYCIFCGIAIFYLAIETYCNLREKKRPLKILSVVAISMVVFILLGAYSFTKTNLEPQIIELEAKRDKLREDFIKTQKSNKNKKLHGKVVGDQGFKSLGFGMLR